MSSIVPAVDLIERLSTSSHPSAFHEDKYDGIKTPNDLEDGALRVGPPPSLLSVDALALVSQYMGTGMMMGFFNNITYPFFAAYFHLEGSKINAAAALITLAWSFKAFIGILSDCFPIFGQRRRPYMLLGWGITCLCMIILAVMDHGAPLYIDRALDGLPLNNLTQEELKGVNPKAPSNGSFIVLMCTVASFGYVIANTCADALLVEYAQREPIHQRGRFQSLMNSSQFVTTAMATLTLGLCCNSPRFGGTFSWDIGVNGIFIILAIATAIVFIVTFFLVREEKRPAHALSAYFEKFWVLAQKRVMWQVMIYLFFSSLFANYIRTTAASYVQLYWAKVEAFNAALISAFGSFIVAGVLVFMGSFGLNWNWRVTIVLCTLLTNSIDAVVQFCTI